MSAEPRRVLITGATGFIGRTLTRALLERGFRVRITGQERDPGLEALGAQWWELPDLSGEVDWRPALEGVDGVVHLAGIAHRFETDVSGLWETYDKVNHQATRQLVQAIREGGRVGRFLFASTVRVHGDPQAMPVRSDFPLVGGTPYDKSKLDAEAAVRQALDGSVTAWAILRPVLVYGPGNRGNMAKLEGLIRRSLPVPVGFRPNRRSFLFVGNLVDAMVTYLAAAEPPSGRTWIVSDGQPASTEDLVRQMAKAMACQPHVLRLPAWCLGGMARLGDLAGALGLPCPWNSETRTKLLGDFYVDSGPIQADLGWTPPFSMEEALRLTYQAPAAGG
jgi:nucleoside-diphosphate-sugar epimerase